MYIGNICDEIAADNVIRVHKMYAATLLRKVWKKPRRRSSVIVKRAR